ncbi:MAG: DUF6036 family nucleotidyltransferase [Candidatus Pacearchaeota archaeon]
MKLAKEMKEILDFINNRKDCVIFAGFAAYLQTGVRASKDIDVFVPSMDAVKKIAKYFSDKGWKQTGLKTDKKLFMASTLKKRNVTFDVIFSKSAKEILMPLRIKIQFNKYTLYSISPESLFLTKMSQLTSPKRTDNKTKRDRQVIARLRKKINLAKLRKLLQKMKDVFWTQGYF